MPNNLSLSKRWIASQWRVARSRDKVLTTRVRVRKQRKRYVQQVQHSHTLQRKLLEHVRAVLDSIRAGQDQSTVEGLLLHLEHEYLEAEQSMGESELQGEQTYALEDHLSDLEYRFGKKEDNLFHHVENALVGEDTGYESAETPSDTISVLSSHESAPTDLPPLLKELYSRLGDRKIHEDRLTDFRMELQQDLDMRETLRGEGQQVSPDDEFYSTRLPEQTQIEAELAGAHADVQSLQQLCLEEGIYVENIFDDYDGDSEALSDAQSEVFSAPMEVEQPPNALYPPEPSRSYGSLSPSESLISGFLNTRDRVRKWLTDETIDEQPLPSPTNYVLSKESSWVKLVPATSPPVATPQGCNQEHSPHKAEQTGQTHLCHSAPHLRASPSKTYDPPPRGRAYSSA